MELICDKERGLNTHHSGLARKKGFFIAESDSESSSGSRSVTSISKWADIAVVGQGGKAGRLPIIGALYLGMAGTRLQRVFTASQMICCLLVYMNDPKGCQVPGLVELFSLPQIALGIIHKYQIRRDRRSSKNLK